MGSGVKVDCRLDVRGCLNASDERRIENMTQILRSNLVESQKGRRLADVMFDHHGLLNANNEWSLFP